MARLAQLAGPGLGSNEGLASGYAQQHGSAKQSHVPGKMFSRSDILAILKAEKSRHTPVFSAGDQHAADQGRARTLADLIHIFTRME
jgi:hypothetical protein